MLPPHSPGYLCCKRHSQNLVQNMAGADGWKLMRTLPLSLQHPNTPKHTQTLKPNAQFLIVVCLSYLMNNIPGTWGLLS